MNPENIHNALNFLDDDLIAETDALRQGSQTLHRRPTVRKVISWVAPAACIVLVLLAGPRLLPAAETGAATPSMENQSSWIQDSMNGGVDESKIEISPGWQTISCGDLSMEIPGTWTHEQVTADDGSYFLNIRPPHEAGSVQVGYRPGFGVCGTGLREEKTLIAGMEATMGFYDGSKRWSYITIRAGERLFVVTKDGAESWWGAHGDTVMQILETLVIAGELETGS